jgi:hypothetical protein
MKHTISLLAGRRILFVGDSLTGQLSVAAGCEAERQKIGDKLKVDNVISKNYVQ